MTTWLPAVLIGAVLGYGIIFLRENGWLIAAIATTGLVVYWRQGRHRDIGLLIATEGIWPALVAGWGLYRDATRVDTEVGPEMWLFLITGLLLILVGVVIVRSSGRRANPS